MTTLLSSIISPPLVGWRKDLLLYFGDVSLKLSKWDTFFEHLVNLGWCPLK